MPLAYQAKRSNDLTTQGMSALPNEKDAGSSAVQKVTEHVKTAEDMVNAVGRLLNLSDYTAQAENDQSQEPQTPRSQTKSDGVRAYAGGWAS